MYKYIKITKHCMQRMKQRIHKLKGKPEHMIFNAIRKNDWYQDKQENDMFQVKFGKNSVIVIQDDGIQLSAITIIDIDRYKNIDAYLFERTKCKIENNYRETLLTL